MQQQTDSTQSALDTFGAFLATQKGIIDPWELVINLTLAAIFSYLLSLAYRYLSTSDGDRNSFARNFLLLSTTTLLIITIVKSSLALSLGLVGALSIVRFRSAIKEPEELTFLFLAIAVGLGLGANQRTVTVVGFSFILALILIRAVFNRGKQRQSYHLIVSLFERGNSALPSITEIVSEHCSFVKLKRFDNSEKLFEATFSVELGKFSQLDQLQKSISDYDSNARITFLDLKGLVR